MNKGRFLYIISIIALISMALNFIFWSTLGHFVDEEERLKKSAWDLQSVSYPNFDYYQELVHINELPIYKEDSIILIANRTINNLLTIMGEMVNNSGGYDRESRNFVNPYAIKMVQNYFYGDNNFRNNAIDFYDETINQYLNISNQFNVSPELIRNLDVREDTSKNRLFESMTLVESFSFLNNICYIITIDVNNYIINKTFANNGEHP